MSYLPKTFTPEQFGAKGDGSNDDTSAITAALAAAGTGGTVLFASGKSYKTTSLISIPADNMTLLGYGAVITSANDTQYQKFQFLNLNRGAVLGLRFECLYSSAGVSLGSCAIQIYASNDITVRDCTFNEIASGGVVISGVCARCTIEANRFYKNFCAIWVDDDLTNNVTHLRIVNNHFRTSISNATYSGAIKISGQPGAVYHVIEGNIIDDAGEMGIEVQGPSNFTVGSNVVSNTTYGISISESSHVSVAGNSVNNTRFVGIEIASNSRHVAVDGNNVHQTGEIHSIAVFSNSKHISIVGNTLINETAGAAVLMQSGPVTLNGNTVSGVGSFYCQDTNNITMVGNNFIGDGNNAFAACWLDGTTNGVTGIIFSNNQIMGGYNNCVMKLWSPNSSIINRVIVSNNVLKGFYAAGAFSTNFGSNSYATLKNFHVFDNIAEFNDYQYSFQVINSTLSSPLYWPTGSAARGYDWIYWQNSMTKCDATSYNPLTIQLPDVASVGPSWSTTFMKSDSSSNPVVFSTYGGQTINGNSTACVNAQYRRITFTADADNWYVTQSG
jgi:parallel beta-helix repeat protein